MRVLFLGHEATHHPSNDYYPMLAKALGREAIYFDYVTSVEEALGNADYLNRFDALLLYANHGEITPTQWANLLQFVEKGHGFLPIHCASWCFANEPGFDQLVGGRLSTIERCVHPDRSPRACRHQGYPLWRHGMRPMFTPIITPRIVWCFRFEK